MAHESDVTLGIELATVYDAGQEVLPAVAPDHLAACEAIPLSVSIQTNRTGGISDDPGPVFDHVRDRINKIINATSGVPTDVGGRGGGLVRRRHRGRARRRDEAVRRDVPSHSAGDDVERGVRVAGRRGGRRSSQGPAREGGRDPMRQLRKAFAYPEPTQ